MTTSELEKLVASLDYIMRAQQEFILQEQLLFKDMDQIKGYARDILRLRNEGKAEPGNYFETLLSEFIKKLSQSNNRLAERINAFGTTEN